MTQVKTGNQHFVDPESERLEQERRADLAANPAYQRGILEAQRNARENAERTFQDELANLRRVTVKRDTTQAARDSYERTYARVRAAAEGMAAITGREQRIPAYLPKAEAVTEYVTVGAPPVNSGQYRETRGLGPSGKGIPPAIPGSGADHDWIERPAEQGGGKRGNRK